MASWSNRWRSLRRYRARLLPLALFILLVSVPIGIWWFIDIREDLSLEDLTDQYATGISIQIKAAMDTRIGGLRVLAERIAEDPTYRADGFERSARRRLREFPGVVGLTFVDRTHILRWAYPLNPELASLVGKDASKFPTAPYTLKAAATGIPAATPPLDLLVGGRGFVCAFPAFRDGARIGSLGAIVRIDEIMRVALGGDPSPDFALAVSDGTAALFVHGSLQGPGRFIATRQVQVLDRRWTVAVSASEHYIAQHKTFTKTLLLTLGLILSAAVALAYSAALDGRRRAERIQQRFQDIAESATDWLWELDADYRFTYVSPQVRVLYGRGPETLLGQERRELPWPEDNPPQVLEEYRRIMMARQPFRNFEFRSRNVAGRIVVARLSGVPIFDEGGRFAGYRGTGTNITAEVEAKQATEQAERRLHAAMESLPGGFLLYGADRRLVMWNSHLQKLYPKAYPQLRAGMTFAEVARLASGLHLQDGGGGRAGGVQRRSEETHTAPREEDLLLDNGTLLHAIDWRTTDGATICLRFDVTEARDREEQLRSAKSLLFDAIEAVPAAFTLWDKDERLALWNTTVEAMNPALHGHLRKGMSFEEFVAVVSVGWKDVATEPARQAECKRRVAAFRGAPSTTDIRLKDGRAIQRIDWRSANNATVSMSFDVTEARRREDELRHAQKMEAMGQLTGGIAHDFNNLLTVIIGYGEFLKGSAGLTAQDRESLDSVLGAATRGSSLIKRLLMFSRAHALQVTAVNPNTLIAELAPLLERTLGETVRIVCDLDPAVGTVATDRGELENVLMNLAINSRDAMGHGGTLTLRSRRVSEIPGQAGAGPGTGLGWVEIRVADTGEGMSEETARRAFDPFFTTKETGKGTGLGLSMVYSFAQSSKGHVEIASAPGRGTTVCLWLPGDPAAAAPAAPDAQARADLNNLGDGRRALIVEDDADVGAYAREVMESLGFRTALVRDSAQAQEQLRGDGPWDVLFTDVVLPGAMSGPELARWAHDRVPALPVLFTSGYAQKHDQGGTLRPLLRKPYRKADLVHELSRLLTPHGGARA